MSGRLIKRTLRGRLGDTWFLDEVFVTINGERQYLWRAVDQDGDLIDILGRLIFSQANDIGVLTMEGERTVEMLIDAESPEAEPALSPDGRWLAYTTAGSVGPVLYVRPWLGGPAAEGRVRLDLRHHQVRWAAIEQLGVSRSVHLPHAAFADLGGDLVRAEGGSGAEGHGR